MLHSKLFLTKKEYRNEKFTTCKEDRPVFAQFCSNDPEILFKATETLLKEHVVDAIDINFGCPQTIAKKGYYGSYLMDDLKLVRSLVEKLNL